MEMRMKYLCLYFQDGYVDDSTKTKKNLKKNDHY
jgi:hypothetical protein